ncbi:hypothetical protein [Laceyella putida]|uniref:Uncharacterized protein n=1 Tax=Laceyella putida TaxID=110101 RepID=A0ABW2RIF4_9BACL
MLETFAAIRNGLYASYQNPVGKGVNTALEKQVLVLQGLLKNIEWKGSLHGEKNT